MTPTQIRTLTLLFALSAGTLAACGPDDRRPAPIRTEPTPNNAMSDSGTQDDDAGTNDGTPDTGTTPNNRNNTDPDPPDMGDTPDEDTGLPPDDDMGAPGDDMGDLPYGEVCPYTDLPDFAGTCNPVSGVGCVEPEVCQLFVYLVGNDTRFVAECDVPAVGADLTEGEPCVGRQQSCAAGLVCINFYDECRPICFADNAAGCDPGEACRSPSPSWGGLGFCDVDCNL